MTRRLSLRLFAVPALIVILAGLGWSAPGWAISLQDAKAQGLVGEQPNGYLGLVKSTAGADVIAMMNNINAQRKKEYQAIARRNNTELNVVEALAGKKAIEMTPSGQYVKLPSGQWVKR
ncbi:MAG: YdbL family protein [Gammaproteobacteria bacterium]|nr:YdbL family protein [Gammaproteobacteria bacterium]